MLAAEPNTGKTRTQQVTRTLTSKGTKHLVTITIDTDAAKGTKAGSLTATDNHPFWLPREHRWAEARELKPGTWLRTSTGTWVQVTAIKAWTAHAQRVHNLTVTGDHTYHVEAGDAQVLVHNCGFTEDDAILARSRAEEIQRLRNDYPNAANHGTTAVIGVFNRRTQEISIRIGINGNGELPEGVRRDGESFVRAAGHAEESVLNDLGRDEFVVFGGTSRNICIEVCYRLLNSRSMRFGGQGYMGGRPDKTPFSLFWAEED